MSYYIKEKIYSINNNIIGCNVEACDNIPLSYKIKNQTSPFLTYKIITSFLDDNDSAQFGSNKEHFFFVNIPFEDLVFKIITEKLFDLNAMLITKNKILVVKTTVPKGNRIRNQVIESINDLFNSGILIAIDLCKINIDEYEKIKVNCNFLFMEQPIDILEMENLITFLHKNEEMPRKRVIIKNVNNKIFYDFLKVEGLYIWGIQGIYCLAMNKLLAS